VNHSDGVQWTGEYVPGPGKGVTKKDCCPVCGEGVRYAQNFCSGRCMRLWAGRPRVIPTKAGREKA